MAQRSGEPNSRHVISGNPAGGEVLGGPEQILSPSGSRSGKVGTVDVMKLGYHFALRWAQARRRRYTGQLPRIARLPHGISPECDATFFSFSGTRDLPEMVACLRSFLRFVMAPRRIVVVGDGTHTDSDRAILSALHPRLETLPWDRFIRSDLPPWLTAYAQAHPLGKKVAVLMSVPSAGPWIFSDSDILYFPAASDIRARILQGLEAPEFLEDCYPSLDDRLIRGDDEKRSPVNSGFALVGQPLDWTDAMARLQEMPGEPGYFTEQTLFHLAMRRSGGRGLPKDRYVIQSDDQWMARDRHVNPSVVLRHYFSSIRYKMWLKVPFT